MAAALQCVFSMSRFYTNSPTSGSSRATRRGWVRLHASANDASTAAAARIVAWIMGTGIVVASLWFGGAQIRKVLLDENPHFTLRDLRISTGGNVTPEQIRQVTGIREGRNLFKFNLPRVRRDFLRVLPNVREMQIERHLPGTLQITVHERTPVARLSRTGRKVVDFDGYMFIMPPSQDSLADSLPLIASEEWAALQPGQRIGDDSRLALVVLDVADGMRLSFSIVELDLTNARELVMITRDRQEIRFPWSVLKHRDVVTRMFANVSTAMRSPRAANCNLFIASADGKVYARYD